MQKQSPTIHILSREINTFIKKILLRFLLPSVVQSTSAANVDLDDPNLYVPLDEVFVGDKANMYLINDESDLTTSDVRRFQETCRNFWSTAAKYAISKLPLENDLLKSVTWIHPHVRDYSKVSEVLLCASELVQVIKEEEKAKLREEFMDYCTSELPPHLTQTSTQEMPIDTYWHNIAHVKDDSGELKYQLLSKLAKSILIIPHGNADVERTCIFTHMGFNKTKVRNSLSVDTLTALLQPQYNVKEPCFHLNQQK